MDEIDMLRLKLEETPPADQATLIRGRRTLTRRMVGPKVIRLAYFDRRRRTVALRVGAVAAAAAVGVVGVDAVNVGGRSVGSSASAATLLNQAADQAFAAQDFVVKPDQYLHRSFKNKANGIEIRTEVWVPSDPQKEWVKREIIDRPGNDDSIDIVKARRGNFFPAPAPMKEFGSRPQPRWQDPSYGFTLPKSPQALDAEVNKTIQNEIASSKAYDNRPEIKKIIDKGVKPSSMSLIDTTEYVIRDILVRPQSIMYPKEVRSGLLRLLAKLPNVTVSDRKVIINGRQGVELITAGGGGDNNPGSSLVVDAAQGQVLSAGDSGLSSDSESVYSYEVATSAPLADARNPCADRLCPVRGGESSSANSSPGSETSPPSGSSSTGSEIPNVAPGSASSSSSTSNSSSGKPTSNR